MESPVEGQLRGEALVGQGRGRARQDRPRSTGQFGVWHLAGLTVVALVIGSPLLARSASELDAVVRLAREGAADTARAPRPAPVRAPTRRRLVVPSVGSWADRVGVPVGPPTTGPVSSGFGLRRHPVWGGLRHHAGIDLAARWGAPVRTTASGVVASAGPAGGYGLRVEVFHPASGLTTRYAHLSRFAPGLRVGSRIRRGQLVGFVGSTGVVTAAHLHYEVLRPDGRAVDPAELTVRYRTAYARASAELRDALRSERQAPAAPRPRGHTGR